MMLFLAALFMLFAASMVGYVLIRLAASQDVASYQGQPPRIGVPLGTLSLPKGLWVSTLLMILTSVAMHAALRAIRIDNRPLFRKLLVASCLLAVGFVAVQTPCLWMLISEHWVMLEQRVALYGMVFVFILLHALHVIGGLIPLGIVTRKAFRDAYSPTDHNTVSYTVLYWHFLDGVWIVMYGIMLALG